MLNANGDPYTGHCWPGYSHWLDFMNPETTALLKEIYCGEHDKTDDFIWTDSWVHIWNDMNEPADFKTVDKTMPKTNKHNFGDGRIFDHKEVHSLYGHYNSKATYEALLARNKHTEYDARPFILTRSFSAGT